jgi:hypothetical protein
MRTRYASGFDPRRSHVVDRHSGRLVWLQACSSPPHERRMATGEVSAKLSRRPIASQPHVLDPFARASLLLQQCKSSVLHHPRSLADTLHSFTRAGSGPLPSHRGSPVSVRPVRHSGRPARASVPTLTPLRSLTECSIPVG